jgi:hypothetical protein
MCQRLFRNVAPNYDTRKYWEDQTQQNSSYSMGINQTQYSWQDVYVLLRKQQGGFFYIYITFVEKLGKDGNHKSSQ